MEEKNISFLERYAENLVERDYITNMVLFWEAAEKVVKIKSII